MSAPTEKQEKPLLGNTRGAKLTVTGILTAIVGSGGYFVQRAASEVEFLHDNAKRHELKTVQLTKDVEDLKAELRRLEDILIDRLQITIPKQPDKQ